MGTFKVKVTSKVLLTEIFEIEADSADDAIELYASKLAGSIEPVHSWTDEWAPESKEDVVIDEDDDEE